MPKNDLWHSKTIDAVCDELDTNEDGLTDEDAAERLNQFGPNSLDQETGASPLKLLAHQVNNPLIYLLIGAAVLSLTAGKQIDAGVILGVILLNTALGFFQEWRAEGALAALQKMTAPHAQVLRHGKAQEINADEVVPGDIILLETGSRVAADARIIASDELRIDESALTGESDPVQKDAQILDQDSGVFEQRNMARMSTSVTGGRGKAVVTTTGMNTEIGKIAGTVRTTGREQTPLQKRMEKLGVLLGIGGVTFAAISFGLGLIRGYETMEILLFSVAVAVSAIPEGLPAVINVTLALGVRRMAQQNALIRRLPAVETLGSTTVICSDKTGTITKNEMTVVTLWYNGKQWTVEKNQDFDELQLLLRIGVLNNNATVQEEDGRWKVSGNPSEAALLTVGKAADLERDTLEETYPRLQELPFSSDNKYMGTVHQNPDSEDGVLYIKGAPDRVLGFCSHGILNGERVELDESKRQLIAQAYEGMAGDALRVMAAAYRKISNPTQTLERQDAEHDLTFVGLWGIVDPPRDEVTQAVQDAKGAGVRPIMITGDHAATALSIAKQVDITDGDTAITGNDIDAMDEEQLGEAALREGVFARVTPAHKLNILHAVRKQGHIVAMTGDGVNDAPALKGADIGIAMGQAGTEVAKEAADMVLTDDNFATIVRAVEEGRVIFNNLRRVVFFLLATNLGEILTLIGALLIGLDLPLTAVMVLWINLVTDGACTIPLGIEPKHRDVLNEPPRNPKSFIINPPLARRMAILTPLMAIGTLSLFHYYSQDNSLAYARTVAFCTMAAFQWFQGFNARSQRQSITAIGILSNKWLLLGLTIAISMQLLVVYTETGRLLFGTELLQLVDWLRILGVSSSILIVDELLKLLRLNGNHD